MLLLGIDILRR